MKRIDPTSITWYLNDQDGPTAAADGVARIEHAGKIFEVAINRYPKSDGGFEYVLEAATEIDKSGNFVAAAPDIFRIANPAAVALGCLGGAARSEAKAAAVRENARKGGWPKGRPRKTQPE